MLHSHADEVLNSAGEYQYLMIVERVSAVSRSRTRAIGLLCNAFGDPYSMPMLQSAIQRLNQGGFHAISFCGGFPKAPLYLSNDGVPSVPPVVDSLILLSATLRSIDVDLHALASRNPGLVVSIGVNLPGVANIGANDEAGVFQAVAHLVKRHECKRIAYIAGPEESADAGRRLAAYRLALEQFGLTYDPTLIARGDYEAHSGREAVLRLRQPGSKSFDAVVAANDLMAIGAIEGLRAAGLRVPSGVKVVGFDDLDEAAFMSPGLTTVRQPIVEQGSYAAELVMRHLAGEAIEPTPTLISTPLVVRRSCGCGAEPAKVVTSVRPPPPSDVTEEHELVEDALRVVIRKQLAARRVHRELSRMAEGLMSARDYPELASVMTGVVRLLNAERFLLCTYAANQRFARVTLESSGRDVVFRNQSEAFPVSQLLPNAFLKSGRPTRLFVEPLQVAEEQFGYLVVEGNLTDGIAQLELRHFVGAALSRIALTRELRRLYSVEKKRSDQQRSSSGSGQHNAVAAGSRDSLTAESTGAMPAAPVLTTPSSPPPAAAPEAASANRLKPPRP